MRLSPISYAKPTHITPLLLLLLLGASPKGTDAKKWGGEERTIIYSCQISLTQYEYACTSDLWWGCTCTYPPQLGALLQCSSQYSPSANIFNDSLSVIQEFCSEFALHHWEIGDLRAQTLNASGYVIGDQDGAATGAPFYVPVLPPKAKVLGYKKAYDVFFGSLDLNSKLASGILGFWGSILLAVSLFNNVLKRFRWSHSFFAANRWSSRFRAVVTVPTLFQGGRHKTDTIWGLIPTRFESIILVLYLIVDVYLTVIRYHIFDPNLLFSGRTMQMLKYLADRTGTIAFDHLPLLILFAGRNNLLIKFTGLPYSTFSAFHRWTARGMFLNAFIHSVSYSMYMALQKSYFTEYMDPYWICGVCATASAGILIASSTYYLRKYYYELFLISHIVLALIFLVACLLHQYLMPYPFDVSMVWLALTLWGSDRAIRLYSVLRFGIKIADLTLVDDETIVIKITDRPSHWQPKPGNFVYITFLTPRMAWESHPFTICDSVFQDREVSIYMKVKKGITSRLREKIIRDSEKAATTPLLRDGISKTISLRVCVDGPYGNHFPLLNYSNVLLVAGGSGIPGLYQHALSISRNHAMGEKNVRLLWIIRDFQALKSFYPELMQLKHTSVQVEVFLTKDDTLQYSKQKATSSSGAVAFTASGETPATAQRTDKCMVNDLSFIRFHSHQRPNLGKLVEEYNGKAGNSAIISCGPGRLCDDLRNLVSISLGQESKVPGGVDYFEELQIW